MGDLLISLDFEGKTVGLTASSLHKSTIARSFNVPENGLHLKVSRNGKIENIWPSSNGKFLLPHGVTNATVIAFSAEEYQDEEDFSPSMRCHYRQNSTLSIFVNGASVFVNSVFIFVNGAVIFVNGSFIFVNGAFIFVNSASIFTKWCI